MALWPMFAIPRTLFVARDSDEKWFKPYNIVDQTFNLHLVNMDEGDRCKIW